jgi:hypothetical protein
MNTSSPYLMKTFKEKFLNEPSALYMNIHDYIDWWHNTYEGLAKPLHEILGLTMQEYVLFVDNENAFHKQIYKEREYQQRVNFAVKFNDEMSDVERWKWIQESQKLGILVLLDNDCTYAKFDGPEYYEIGAMYFDSYIGSDDGVYDLLEAMNIKHSGV